MQNILCARHPIKAPILPFPTTKQNHFFPTYLTYSIFSTQTSQRLAPPQSFLPSPTLNDKIVPPSVLFPAQATPPPGFLLSNSYLPQGPQQLFVSPYFNGQLQGKLNLEDRCNLLFKPTNKSNNTLHFHLTPNHILQLNSTVRDVLTPFRPSFLVLRQIQQMTESCV